MLFGGCPQGATACFDTARVHYDEISLVGAFHFSPADVKKAYDMLSGGVIDVKPLITGEYPLDELVTAFKRLEAGAGIKYAIIP
jgi:L-iditol 2-dehydrogenase